MFFGKRRTQGTNEPASIGSIGEEIVESAKTSHGRFTLIPRAKQLVNGNWIARITLEEEATGGPRSYDFGGPMAEFENRENAVQGGIEHAKRRLDEIP